MKDQKIIVQGFPGCFHEEAAIKYFGRNDFEVVPAISFPVLAEKLVANPNDHMAIIAIENSIAGSLLQNYRILRENQLRVVGEVYLRIRHNFMVLPGQSIEDIKEVHSHPMALNQCLDFLNQYPGIRMVEAEDTALSAKRIREEQLKGIAAIASETAAEIYDLEILGKGIETSDVNYTRFFIVQDGTQVLKTGSYNKASIYLRVSHQKGSLLKVLKVIYQYNINLSKLQSYPVLGEVNAYYFHLDLEFENKDEYSQAIEALNKETMILEILGVYKKANVYDHQTVE